MKVAYRFYYPWWREFRILSIKKYKKTPILKLQLLGNEFFFYGKDLIVRKLTHFYRSSIPRGYMVDISKLKS